MRKLRIATRKSPLALWQANHIKDQLHTLYPNMDIELLPMVTSGDRFLKNKLQRVGGKGLFVKELEEALLDGRADIAVHSMKDVPAELPQGLSLPIICPRESPFDAFVSTDTASIEQLPQQAIVGTASIRREAQLLRKRPDLIIKLVRGNIQTRLKKLKDESFDAIILAASGLMRMGLENNIREIISPKVMLPSCGQGALGIECRSDDISLIELLTPLACHITTQCVHSERRVNAKLGGNCHVPLAVFATPESNNQIQLQAKLFNATGTVMLEASGLKNMADSLVLAEECADALLSQGAMKLLSELPE